MRKLIEKFTSPEYKPQFIILQKGTERSVITEKSSAQNETYLIPNDHIVSLEKLGLILF